MSRGAIMTAAAEIASALGDARRERDGWRCRCPLHGGGSLVLHDGDAGRVLVTCWGGCNRLDVLAELRRHGLLDGGADHARQTSSALRPTDGASRSARALKIWHTAKDGADTIVRRYLATREIKLDHWPPSLRFHSRCQRPRDTPGNFLSPLPAMVALVEHIECGPVAVHCTYLRPDGSDKADIERPKAMFGSVASGAVRFGMPRAGEWLAVAEGIETALSIAVARPMSVWAALSASGIKNLALPPEATHVLIYADHDANGTGESVAHDAATRCLLEGRCVRTAMPPEPGADFNDVLTRRGTASCKNEAAYVIA
jgi:hypothetical protein